MENIISSAFWGPMCTATSTEVLQTAFFKWPWQVFHAANLLQTK